MQRGVAKGAGQWANSRASAGMSAIRNGRNRRQQKSSKRRWAAGGGGAGRRSREGKGIWHLLPLVLNLHITLNCNVCECTINHAMHTRTHVHTHRHTFTHTHISKRALWRQSHRGVNCVGVARFCCCYCCCCYPNQVQRQQQCTTSQQQHAHVPRLALPSLPQQAAAAAPQRTTESATCRAKLINLPEVKVCWQQQQQQ